MGLLLEKSKLAQHAYEDSYTVRWDKARIFEVESNSRYRITRTQPIWHVELIPSANPVWEFLLSGSPSSAKMFQIHREDLYEVADSS
jgi:hypothetical protein